MSFYEQSRENSQTIIFRKGVVSFPAHFHKNLEFVYSLTDNFKVVIDGKEIVLSENELLIIDGYSVHHIISEDLAISLVLPLSLSSDFDKLRRSKVFSSLTVKDHDGNIYQSLLAFDQHKRNNFLTNKGLTDLFLGLLLNYCPLTTATDKQDALIISVIKFLHDNYDKPLSLESIAKQFNYSPFTISHYFKAQTGINLKSYINNLRLNIFMEKFSENTQNLTELISECGFTSPQTFYRVFYSVYKTSPKQFIKKR